MASDQIIRRDVGNTGPTYPPLSLTTLGFFGGGNLFQLVV